MKSSFILMSSGVSIVLLTEICERIFHMVSNPYAQFGITAFLFIVTMHICNELFRYFYKKRRENKT